MCTLVVAARLVPGYSLAVVANRDELLARPSRAPFAWPAEPGRARFVAPRDEVAGGTWLGWNEHGVFVAITNRFLGPRDPDRVSRGRLVVDALGEPSAAAIHARMARIDPRAYNGFHLVYADRADVLATIGDGATLAQLSLGDGLSIVTERSFSAVPAARSARIRDAWARRPPDAARLGALLTEHDADPAAATCLHLEDRGYGTRSSMVLLVPVTNRAPPTMTWAEGPPCRSPFEPIDLAI